MIPLAVPLAVQGGLAAGQLIAGGVAAANNRRPDLDPLQRNIADAERIANSAQARATYGFDPYTRNAQLNRYRGLETALATSAREGGLTPAQTQAARVSGAMQAGAGRVGVLSQDAQLREAKQQYADSALRAVADPRTALFNEETSRFQQRAASANALLGAGLQNVGNLGQDLSDIAGADRYFGQLQGMMKKYSDPMLNPYYRPVSQGEGMYNKDGTITAGAQTTIDNALGAAMVGQEAAMSGWPAQPPYGAVAADPTPAYRGWPAAPGVQMVQPLAPQSYVPVGGPTAPLYTPIASAPMSNLANESGSWLSRMFR